MPKVVFHHINKCAGTTLLKYLQNYFSSERCLFVEEYEDLADFASNETSSNLLARAHFIHDPFGTWNWSDKLANVRTLCFFQDPLDRLISDWWMINRWTDEEAESSPDGVYIRDLARNDPKGFFSSTHPEVGQLSWNRIAQNLACAPQSARQALENGTLDSPEFRSFIRERAEKTLRSLSFIGFQDDFERSMQAMQLWLALPPELPQPLNVHKSAQRKPTLSEEALQIARARIDLDIELVAMAHELYQIQMERFQATFGDDFASAANQSYLKNLDSTPKWSVIDMAGPLNGTGWHCREINGSKHSRWIGPAPEATFDALIDKENDLLLRIRVTNILEASQIDNITVTIDGNPVEVHKWMESPFVVVCDAVIHKQNLDRSSNVLRGVINCNKTVLITDPNDGRRLGLEISGIEIGPLDKFIPGQPGTPDEARGLVGYASARFD